MIDLRNFNVNACCDCGKLPTIEYATALNGKFSMWHDCEEEPKTYVEFKESFASVTEAVDAWNAVNPVVTELAEADRRAGEAERKMADMQDTIYKHRCWNDEAKDAAGYHRNVSFDIVWAETLQKAKERDEWMQAALATRLCRADVDVSTPEKFKTAQTFAASTLIENLKALKKEVVAIIELYPQHAVRVREGNGPENIAASLAVTVANIARGEEANPNKPQCKCRRCLTERGEIKTFSMTGHDITTAPTGVNFVGMIVCETCGNKRCPHATDHRHACTDSNEPGQDGSIFK